MCDSKPVSVSDVKMTPKGPKKPREVPEWAKKVLKAIAIQFVTSFGKEAAGEVFQALHDLWTR